MFHRHQTDALVVGAGPVGLCAAASLARAGLRLTIVDRRWQVEQRAGAVLLHPQSLALLHELGTVYGLLGVGARIERVGFWDEQGTRHALLELSQLEEPYPFALVLPQRALIDHLVDVLASRDVFVSSHQRLASLEQKGEALIARVDELDRESTGYAIAGVEEMVARSLSYETHGVIGADGEDSIVRLFLGGRYERAGTTGVRVVFELSSSWTPGDEARVIVGEHGICSVFPLPHGMLQWSFHRRWWNVSGGQTHA